MNAGRQSNLSLFAGVAATAERLLARRRAALRPVAELLPLGDRLRSTPDRITVRLLALNDFHGALTQGISVGGRPAGGAAYLAAYLARERAAHPERTLLVHAGDMFGLTPPLSGLLQDEPAAAVLNHLGFDAGVVGNHEFDEGLDELMRLVDGGSHPGTVWRLGTFPGLTFPSLAANVIAERTGHPVLPAYWIMTVAGIRVGVIGVVTTESARRLGRAAAGLRFADEAATVNRYAQELRGHNVAAVVVLAHLGGQQAAADGPISGAIVPFVSGLDDTIDVVVSGHTHQPYRTEIAGKLVVQAHPFGGSYAAIDLEIDRRANRVVERRATLIPTWHDQVKPDAEVATLVTSYERAAAQTGEPVLAAAGAAVTRESDDSGQHDLGRLVAGAYRAATGAEVAICHPAELRADLPAGPLTRADLYRTLPYGHDLLVLRLTGNQLRRLLEERCRDGRGYRPQTAGIGIEVDLDRPAGRRVNRIWLEGGKALDLDATYSVALSTLAAGSGNLSRTGEAQIAGKTLGAFEAYLRSLPRPFTLASAERPRTTLAAS